MWGSNVYGQLNVPEVNANFVAIAAGAQHCLALRNDGAWAGMTLRAETDFQFAVADGSGARLLKAPVAPRA